MSPLHLILKEIWHHRWNSLWTALVLTAAVALLVAIRLTADAAERETRRVMRDLGFNLRIIPAGTDTAFLWSKGYPDLTMPESHARHLAEQKGVFLTFNHLTATLRQRYPLARGEVILEGVSPSISDEGKKPMGYSIPKGSLFLGHHAAQLLQAQRGQPVQLGGRTFQVERVLAESGTEDDIRVYAHLADAQAILNLPGRINEIQAVDCLCLTSDQDPLAQLRATLTQLLPGTQVLHVRALADARARQRQMAEKYAAFSVPLVLVIAALWVGAMAVLNVRQRRSEIGLWRALGHGGARLTTLFLGKAALLGAFASLLGATLGTVLALAYGPSIFHVTAAAITWNPKLILVALVVTPAFAAFAAFVPAMVALNQDPIETLRAD
ncbi:MAG: FtsX-like permease family protein [Verrucomicrobiales bacterium]|nr:FtsX-like permease family protein [Verrucomicrobiales bacterium]